MNTQEMIALVRELQQGYRPDLVLFYDGVNDTTSALLERQPTVTTNERNRVREFNILQSPRRLASALAGNVIRSSALYRFARSLGRRSALAQDWGIGAAGETNLDGLAMGVVDGYAANVRLLEVLGKSYGFRSLFVWQPDIFTKPKLVPFETAEEAKYGWASAIFAEVHEQIENAKELRTNPRFMNLSGIFADSETLEFLDFCHTTEAANARIAAVLAARLVEIARTSTAAN